MTVENKRTWLHLGAGAFHRAHQAWYLNQLRENRETDWHMALANIRNSATQEMLQHLHQQQGRYTLESISPQGEFNYQTISAIKDIILWDEGIRSVIKCGAQASTKIISFTVTEGGYFLDDDGHLDITDKAIAADLREEGETRTLYGALSKILRARMAQDSGPVTLLSCDNLRNNGDSFYRGLIEFVQAQNNSALEAWIRANTRAPNSMVDRITPKYDPQINERLAQQGIEDRAPLTCETFSQWVIEDDFIAGRPALEKVGVEFTERVTPYEEAKIRILNASHSGIAWAGALVGKKYIDQSIALPQVDAWIRAYVLDDVAAALHPAAFDLTEYCDTTLERFGNRWVRDTNQRVSSDSIAKMHEFIVPTLKQRYQQGETPRAAMILPALFFLFMQARQQQKLPFDYQDRAIDSVDFDAIFAADDALLAYASNKKLFGSLAQKKELISDLRDAVAEVKRWLSSQEK